MPLMLFNYSNECLIDPFRDIETKLAVYYYFHKIFPAQRHWTRNCVDYNMLKNQINDEQHLPSIPEQSGCP